MYRHARRIHVLLRGAPPSPPGRSASKTRVDALMTRGSIILRKKSFCEADGWHRNSGLPELRTVMRRKSGKPDLHRNSGLPELRTVTRRKSGKPDLRCQARQ